jgi:hypothetical protein
MHRYLEKANIWEPALKIVHETYQERAQCALPLHVEHVQRLLAGLMLVTRAGGHHSRQQARQSMLLHSVHGHVLDARKRERIIHAG